MCKLTINMRDPHNQQLLRAEEDRGLKLFLFIFKDLLETKNINIIFGAMQNVKERTINSRAVGKFGCKFLSFNDSRMTD